MQGETDAQNLNMANLYGTMLTHFIEDVRSDLKSPEMPVVIGQINTLVAGYEDTVREAQRAVSLNLDNCFYVTTSDLEMGLLDWWHFRDTSMLELGRRFANALLHFREDDMPAEVQPLVLTTGKGCPPRLPQTVTARTVNGYVKAFPVKFDANAPEAYADAGTNRITGYALYGDECGLFFEADLQVIDGASVDGSLDDAIWKDATAHGIRLTDENLQAPYFPVTAEFYAYAGERGLYFAFDVKDTKLVNNYQSSLPLGQRPFDWELWLNDGIELYLDASGGDSGLTEKSFAVYLTASGLLRVYAPNAARDQWSGVNLYNNQVSPVDRIVRAVTLYGTPNKAGDRDEGYHLEIFIPYEVFGVSDVSSFRVAAVVRSRADTPGGAETPYGVYCNGEAETFSKTNLSSWLSLQQVL